MLSFPLLAWCERHNLQIGDIMSNNTLKNESTVMQHNSGEEYWKKRALDAETELKANEDTRPFEIMIRRNKGQKNNWILVGVANGKEFSADLVKRDNETLISTKDYVNNHKEARKRSDFVELFEKREEYYNLATQKDVVQGDAPSAS